jgi:hypothetical protein
VPESPLPPTSVVGISRGDVARLHRALAGVSYPVDKWQLIEHAECEAGGTGSGDRRAIGVLWALPTDHYLGLAQVMVGAARTARGHPRRGSPGPATRRRPSLDSHSPPAEGEWLAGDVPDGLPERVPPGRYRPRMRLVRADE